MNDIQRLGRWPVGFVLAVLALNVIFGVVVSLGMLPPSNALGINLAVGSFVVIAVLAIVMKDSWTRGAGVAALLSFVFLGRALMIPDAHVAWLVSAWLLTAVALLLAWIALTGERRSIAAAGSA